MQATQRKFNFSQEIDKQFQCIFQFTQKIVFLHYCLKKTEKISLPDQFDFSFFSASMKFSSMYFFHSLFLYQFIEYLLKNALSSVTTKISVIQNVKRNVKIVLQLCLFFKILYQDGYETSLLFVLILFVFFFLLLVIVTSPFHFFFVLLLLALVFFFYCLFSS